MKCTLLVCVLLSGCGTTSDNMDNPRFNSPAPDTTGTDDLLLEHLQVWKEDCLKFSAYDCRKLMESLDDVRLGSLEQGTLGQCKLWTFGFIVTRRDITVSDTIADNPAAIRAVLAHEIGHCALLLGHVEREGHLMAPYLSTDTGLGERLPAMLQQFYADAQNKVIPEIKGE